MRACTVRAISNRPDGLQPSEIAVISRRPPLSHRRSGCKQPRHIRKLQAAFEDARTSDRRRHRGKREGGRRGMAIIAERCAAVCNSRWIAPHSQSPTMRHAARYTNRIRVDDDVSVASRWTADESGVQPAPFASRRSSCTIHCPFPTAWSSTEPSGPQWSRAAEAVASDRIDKPIILFGLRRVSHDVREKAGAVEFLTKPFKDDVLLDAIRGAIERSLTALREESETRELRSRFASLTSREHEVMSLVVSGLLNKQVGGELGISEITVKAHRGHIESEGDSASRPCADARAPRVRFAPATDPPARPPRRSD